MATILVEILGNGRQFKSELASIEGSVARTSGTFGKMGKAAALTGAVLAGGVAVGLVKSLQAAGDFEQSLNVLRATTNATNAEMARASALAIKLGADTHLPAVSAKDAADAMLNLGRDGFTAMQSMAAARGTLLLVTAAQTDVATSAKVVTQNIHAFGLQAKDTNTIVDQMAGFMNATGTDFAAFADSLSYVAAPAHTVGQTFKDTAAELAILSQKGIEGSMAGTGLRQVLVRLGSDGSHAGKLFKSLGVDVIGSNGQFIGMRKTIEEMAPALQKMTSAQRLAFFKDAFGQTAMNQANVLFGTTIANYDKTSAAIARKGQADQLAAAHMKGFNGAMATLGSSLETLEIQIGLKLLPVATRFVNWLTAELPVAISAAQSAIAFLTPYFERFRAVVETVVSAVRSHWSEITAVVKTANDRVRAELTALEPYFLRVKAVVSEVMTAVGPIVRRGWDDVKTIFEIAKTVVLEVSRVTWEPIKTIVIGAMNSVKQVVKTAVDILVNTLRVFDDILHGEWGKAWGALKTLVSTALSDVASLVRTMLSTLATAAGELAVNIVKEIGRGAGKALPGVLAFFSSIPPAILGALGDLSSLLYNAGVSILQGLLNGMKAKVGDVIHFASGIAGSIADVKGPITADRVLLTPHGKAIMDGLIAGMDSRISDLLKMAGSIAGKVAATLKAATAAQQAAFQSAWSSLTSSADSAFQKLHASVMTKTEQIIAAAQAATQAAQLAGNLTSAQGALTAAQSGTPQSDAEKALAAIQSAHDEAGRAQALSTAQDALTAAQTGGDPAAILTAQQQVADAKYNIQINGLQKQIAAEQAAAAQSAAIATAQQAVDAANMAISDAAQQANWAQQAAAERLQLDAQTTLQQTHFDAALTALQTHLAKGHATYAQAQKSILKLFKTFGVDYAGAGAELGIAFVQGLGESIASAATRAGSVTDRTTGVGAAISGSGGVGTVNVYLSDSWVGNDQDIAERLRNVLIRTGRNTTGGVFGGY